jgi:tRNA wybutosine-synthesizing protein 3
MLRPLAEIRFRMVKCRHAKTFEDALAHGKVDEKLIELCRFLEGTKNFFTSSGCSGRIVLLKLKNGRKIDASFHRKWHRTVTCEEVWCALEEQTDGKIWFKMEPFIIHIGTKDLEHAKKILKAKTKAGVKRGGIIVAKEGKFIIELVGTREVALPVKYHNTILVTKRFLEYVVKEANKKLAENDEMLKRLEECIKSEINEG